MKRLFITLTIVAVLAIGAGAFAFGPGWFGGMGHGMMGGYGMGPGMMGWSGTGYGYDQKFLDETRELRKTLNNKRFEYFEALRNPNTTPETITKLEREITDLQNKLYQKFPQTAYRGFGRNCWW